MQHDKSVPLSHIAICAFDCSTWNIKKAVPPFIYRAKTNNGAKITHEKKWKKVAIPYCIRRRDML